MGKSWLAAEGLVGLRKLNSSIAVGSIGQGIGAGLSALTVVVAARQAQFADIAAYAAGLSIAAMLSAVLGGGTSLVYATGSAEERHAVRLVRWRLVAPMMVVATLAASAIYGFAVPGLPLLAIALGGLSVVMQNLAALDAATLQRDRRIGQWAYATAASRLVSLALVGLGASYSIGMVVGGLGLLIVCRLMTGHSSSLHHAPVRMRAALRSAYHPHLTTIAILEVAALYTPFILAPLAADAATAGAFSTLVSSQQTLTSLLVMGLFTIMTVRSGSRISHGALDAERSESILAFLAVPVAILGICGSTFVIRLLNLEGTDGLQLVWIIRMIAIVPIVWNRRATYRYISNGLHRPVTVFMVIIFLANSALSLVAVWNRQLVLLAAATLIAELAGTAWLCVSATLRKRRKALTTREQKP